MPIASRNLARPVASTTVIPTAPHSTPATAADCGITSAIQLHATGDGLGRRPAGNPEAAAQRSNAGQLGQAPLRNAQQFEDDDSNVICNANGAALAAFLADLGTTPEDGRPQCHIGPDSQPPTAPWRGRIGGRAHLRPRAAASTPSAVDRTKVRSSVATPVGPTTPRSTPATAAGSNIAGAIQLHIASTRVGEGPTAEP